MIIDRGVSHEIVHHRIASYSQESTRYVNYSKGKFDSEITVIEPFFYMADNRDMEYALWLESCLMAEHHYMALCKNGSTPQEARSVLPNSLKTEIVMTANPREWRHFFTMRTSAAAHPQMRQVACPLLSKFRLLWPVLFDDVGSIIHTDPAIETFVFDGPIIPHEI